MKRVRVGPAFEETPLQAWQWVPGGFFFFLRSWWVAGTLDCHGLRWRRRPNLGSLYVTESPD